MRDYGNDNNQSGDYGNDVEDYGDYGDQSGTGNIPDYGPQQTIEANSRVGVQKNIEVN